MGNVSPTEDIATRWSNAVRAFMAAQPGAGVEARRGEALRALERDGFSVGETTFRTWERGQVPQLENFARACRAMRVSADAILFGRERPVLANDGASSWPLALAELGEPVLWWEEQGDEHVADPARRRAVAAARAALPDVIERSLADDGAQRWAAQLVDWFHLTDPRALRPDLGTPAAADALVALATGIRKAGPRSLDRVALEVRVLHAAPQLFGDAVHAALHQPRGYTPGDERAAVHAILLACCVGLEVERPPNLRRVAPGDEVRAHVLWTSLRARFDAARAPESEPF